MEENQNNTITKDELETKLKEQKETYLRVIAEYENKINRVQKDTQNAITASLEKLVVDFVPLIADLENAMTNIHQDQIEGLNLIKKNILSILKKNGINSIEPCVGTKFDPFLHQALKYIESDQEDGVILTVIQNGYAFGSKTIIPAVVEIAKNEAC